MTGWVSLHCVRQVGVLAVTGHVSGQREETGARGSCGVRVITDLSVVKQKVEIPRRERVCFSVPLGTSLREAGTSLDLATDFSATLACTAEPFLGVVRTLQPAGKGKTSSETESKAGFKGHFIFTRILPTPFVC